MNTKICTVCKIEKPFSYFYNTKNTKDGKHSVCKSCTSTKAKIYREQNKNKIKEQNKRKCGGHFGAVGFTQDKLEFIQ